MNPLSRTADMALMALAFAVVGSFGAGHDRPRSAPRSSSYHFPTVLRRRLKNRVAKASRVFNRLRAKGKC